MRMDEKLRQVAWSWNRLRPDDAGIGTTAHTVLQLLSERIGMSRFTAQTYKETLSTLDPIRYCGTRDPAVDWHWNRQVLSPDRRHVPCVFTP